MGQDLAKNTVCKDLINKASEILSKDLWKIYSKGPPSVLEDPSIAFPALLTISIAKARQLAAKDSDIIKNCILTTGFSDGELAALTFSGAIPFDIALKYSQLQGKLVKKFSSPEIKHVTVHFNETSRLKEALKDINSSQSKEKMLKTSIFLTPNYKVISGHVSLLKELAEKREKYNLLEVRLLKYPFTLHSPCQRPTSKILRSFLIKHKHDLKDPDIPVVSGEMAEPFMNRFQIVKRFPLQMSRPLRWEQSVQAIFSRPSDAEFPNIYEFNKNDNVGRIIEFVNKKAFDKYNLIKI